MKISPRINYCDREAVIALARKFGPGFVVFKHPDRANYNIVHANRTDRYLPGWVVYSTSAADN